MTLDEHTRILNSPITANTSSTHELNIGELYTQPFSLLEFNVMRSIFDSENSGIENNRQDNELLLKFVSLVKGITAEFTFYLEHKNLKSLDPTLQKYSLMKNLDFVTNQLSPLTLPPEIIVFGNGSDTNLSELLGKISYKAIPANKYQELTNNNQPEIPNNNLDIYHPAKIWESRTADCKQFSILSVAYKRAHKKPARFIQSKTHMAFQEYENNSWVSKEPQYLCINEAHWNQFEPVPFLDQQYFSAMLYIHKLRAHIQKIEDLRIEFKQDLN